MTALSKQPAHSRVRVVTVLGAAALLLSPTAGLAAGASNAPSTCGNPCQGTISITLAQLGHTKADDLEPLIKRELDAIGATYTPADVKTIAMQASPKIDAEEEFSVEACADSGSPCINFILPRDKF